MIGPPSSAPKSAWFQRLNSFTIEPPWTWTALGLPERAPGVHAPKTEPWNSFEPDLVTTLRMPPVERPYSGRYPPVMTLTSFTNSTVRAVPRIPYAVSFTERPSITYWFSGDVVPFTETPYVSECAPGATSASDSKERVAEFFPPGRTTAMLLMKSAPTFTPVEDDPTSIVGA